MKGSKFLLPALLKTLILPPILFALILWLFDRASNLNDISRTLGYILSFPLVYLIRSHLSVYLSNRRARTLGAKEMPRVGGRWPLNLDILVDWAKSGSEEEVGRMMVLLSRRYGKTYNTRVLGEDQIISSDPAVLKHVLVDDFDNFVKGEKFKERAEAFLGDGIFNSDGERWKFHRSLMRPFFHPAHISPSLFIPHIQSFFSSLPTDGEAFDIQGELGRLALNMAVRWMTGEDISSTSCSPCSAAEVDMEWERAKVDLGNAMTQAQKIVGRRVKIGTVWPLFELGSDPLEGPMRTIQTFFRPIISRAVERKTSRENNGVEKSSDERGDLHFIDYLINATDDQKLIEDQLINTLLASRDTLASCLTFCLYVLCLHPEISQRLREEIQTVCPDGQVSKDVIRELKYSRAFINEVLRLYPPVPLNIRRTLRPSLLPSSSNSAGAPAPMYMPANTSIILAFILMQRDKDVWGEDVNEFKPERWMGEGLGKKEREGFMSWNYGPRMCMGQPFALTVTHTFLILFSRYLDVIESGQSESESDSRRNTPKKHLEFAFDAQPEGTAIPPEWVTGKSLHGGGHDGRAREGRDKSWVVAEVVLAIKGGLWLRFAQQDQDGD
ncbi:uncharacterized protein I303_101083 [Kwoniella dejecticola CBS 10117]|uniref:Cytochrome P450 monooxygenase pc-2 n=1 Tax=Kwoniella dejecticola CBS 10117 TaxID=1296121 RepID=A0A1A6AGR9_9TREE|nr:cytochrome P450 monooxygenase pc-2 [Kwoniella dejecticola CBS 10117]OBR89262.1 cytochrome P450 monooxygenase pc-2 [Kwoniella dejecticola CBS 10117]